MARYQEISGYIIHQRDFQNSSLIIEFFSQENGLMHLIIKGAKKNKIIKTQLQYFHFMKIQYFGRSDLKIICNINIIYGLSFKKLKDKATGMYLNELLHHILIVKDKAHKVFNSYEKALKDVGHIKLSRLLRNFEKGILEYSGFELSTNMFSNDDDWLSVNEIDGLYLSQSNKICQVKELSLFLKNKILNESQQVNINKLMYKLINLCLGNKKIVSRDILKSLY